MVAAFFGVLATDAGCIKLAARKRLVIMAWKIWNKRFAGVGYQPNGLNMQTLLRHLYDSASRRTIAEAGIAAALRPFEATIGFD